MFNAYKQLALGFSASADITRMGHVSHGFSAKRVMGYPESHDKDRVMYEALTYGNTGGTNPPNNNLNNALSRMSAIGATSILVPGPKMIWHFAELGMNNSIYANYSRLIDLKINEPVFEGNYAISPNTTNLYQRIYIYDTTLPANQIQNVVVLANFSCSAANITPDFPFTGTWYNLMDDTSINVSSTTAQLNIGPGQFKVFGNRPSTLSATTFDPMQEVALYPNPSNGYISLTKSAAEVSVFTLTGQLIKTFSAVVECEQYLKVKITLRK